MLPQSIINKDGNVFYYGRIFEKENADIYLDKLLHRIEWKNDVVMLFGKKIITKRKTAWYGDKEFSYTYSGITRLAIGWTKELLQLKTYVENIINEDFNTCLLNLYNDGTEGMSWHSDNEKDLKQNGVIASVSFGAERYFSLKHKMTKEKHRILLEHGSLLTMNGQTQNHWLHSIPKTALVSTKRINLTFRTITHTLKS